MSAWWFFLVPLIALALGFGSARFSTRRARIVAALAVLLVPALVLTAVTILSWPTSPSKAEVSFGWAFIQLGLPAFAWIALGLLGYDLGRRSSGRGPERRFR